MLLVKVAKNYSLYRVYICAAIRVTILVLLYSIVIYLKKLFLFPGSFYFEPQLIVFFLHKSGPQTNGFKHFLL